MLFVGCDNTQPEEIFVYVNPNRWKSSDRVEIQFDNRDTVLRQDISLLIRYNNSFSHERVPLFITTVAPDSTYCEEQFLAQFESYFEPTSRFDEVAIPYRSNSVFTQEGTYTFIISPFVDQIEGVVAIGVDVSESYNR